MKSFSFVFLFCFLILSFFYVGNKTTALSATTNKSISPKIVLQLNWKYQFEYAGYIAAKEKEFYTKAGLDVELKEAEIGIHPIIEVLNGRANYGIWSSNLILERLRGKPLV